MLILLILINSLCTLCSTFIYTILDNTRFNFLFFKHIYLFTIHSVVKLVKTGSLENYFNLF